MLKIMYELNFFMNNIFYYWLAVAFCFLILEIGHPGLLLFLSFFCGATAAAFVSIIEPSFMLQCLVFLTISIGALFVVKRWATRHGQTGGPHHKTNVYALQGKQGMVIQDITPNNPGLVKVGGEVWSARSAQQEPILAGKTVQIISVRGAHIVVKQVVQ